MNIKYVKNDKLSFYSRLSKPQARKLTKVYITLFTVSAVGTYIYLLTKQNSALAAKNIDLFSDNLRLADAYVTMSEKFVDHLNATSEFLTRNVLTGAESIPS